MIISIAAGIGAFGIGLGLDYSPAFPYLIPFLLLIAVYLIGKFALGVVSKEIQDRHWRTQLVRFKDPKFFFQKQIYPNANKRELQLERMWQAEYGVEFEDTIAPWYQKARIAILPICVVTGLVIGIIAK